MDHTPSVCPIEPAELLDFCTDSGYSYRVEAQGSLLIPPDYYVGMTDWERSLRLRCVFGCCVPCCCMCLTVASSVAVVQIRENMCAWLAALAMAFHIGLAAPAWYLSSCACYAVSIC